MLYFLPAACDCCESWIFIVVFSAKNGVVVATEKKQKSVLYDESSIGKVKSWL